MKDWQLLIPFYGMYYAIKCPPALTYTNPFMFYTSAFIQAFSIFGLGWLMVSIL